MQDVLLKYVPDLWASDTFGDGNCFWRAIAAHIYGDQEKYVLLKLMTVRELGAHLEFYRKQGLEEVFSNALSVDTWSGVMDAVALSNALKRVILIYGSESKQRSGNLGAWTIFPLRIACSEVLGDPLTICWNKSYNHFFVVGSDSKAAWPVPQQLTGLSYAPLGPETLAYLPAHFGDKPKRFFLSGTYLAKATLTQIEKWKSFCDFDLWQQFENNEVVFVKANDLQPYFRFNWNKSGDSPPKDSLFGQEKERKTHFKSTDQWKAAVQLVMLPGEKLRMEMGDHMVQVGLGDKKRKFIPVETMIQRSQQGVDADWEVPPSCITYSCSDVKMNIQCFPIFELKLKVFVM